jgi:hypothetical protein
MSRPKSADSMDAKVLRRLRSRGSGAVAASTEFLDLGNRASVDQALSRLVRRGELRRVSRGVYGYPERSRLIGELAPRPEQVAQALARRGCQRLLVSGAYAANLLGLSDQVPARIEYLTDGPSQTVMIRNLPVTLKQTTARRLAVADRISGTVAEALRFLRQSQVDESVVARLRARLSAGERRQLVKDIPLVPAWIGEVFRKVGEGEP